MDELRYFLHKRLNKLKDFLHECLKKLKDFCLYIKNKFVKDSKFRYITIATILSLLIIIVIIDNIKPKKEEVKVIPDEGLKVDIKTCFGNKIIKADVPLEEYLAGVLFAEENPTINTNKDYLKAFVLFARTYSLKRGGYGKNKNLSIKSCSSDQNWCDIDQGCYREQTDEMFNQCIVYSLNMNSKKPYYSAQKCANRVTTFPGTKNVSTRKYEVKNPAWPKGYEKVATGTNNRTVWKKPPTEEYKEFLRSIVKETEGLVIKDSKNNIVSLGYMVCNSDFSSNIMCMNRAKKLADGGYNYIQLVLAFTRKYKALKISDYRQ